MMENFNIITEKDKLEAQEREKRRHAELERQNRIFNSKTREIGIDKNALRAQIEEKRQIEEQEKEYERAFERQRIKDNELAIMIANQERQAKQKNLQDLNEYRKTQQQKWKAREFDLNDPDYLKKQTPLRSTDEEVGLPCGQKFEGEDLHGKERAKIMAEQRSCWLKQQIKQNAARNAEEQAAENAYKRAILEKDARAMELEMIDQDCKKQLRAATARVNQLLAEENRNKVNTDLRNEKGDELAEIFNSLSSDLLTENPGAAQSVFGPHRSIAYMYKGMTPEEKSAIRKMQLSQIAEHQARREIEKANENEWNHFTKQLTNAANSNEKAMQESRRTLADQIKEENVKLSKEQREKKYYYDNIVFTNEPTEDYFSQFNTTSR